MQHRHQPHHVSRCRTVEYRTVIIPPIVLCRRSSSRTSVHQILKIDLHMQCKAEQLHRHMLSRPRRLPRTLAAERVPACPAVGRRWEMGPPDRSARVKGVWLDCTPFRVHAPSAYPIINCYIGHVSLIAFLVESVHGAARLQRARFLHSAPSTHSLSFLLPCDGNRRTRVTAGPLSDRI